MTRITLTTIGRRSGEPRSVALYAFEDGDRLVVVGSRGGAAADPAWVLNLRATQTAQVRSGKREFSVRAVEADGEERDRLWELVSEAFPMYRSFQRRTARLIPVFILEPVRND